MNKEELAGIYQTTVARVEPFFIHLLAAFQTYNITPGLREAAFVAQVGHESNRLIFTHEIWSPVSCPWQRHYEYRADLGNTVAGDGEKFKGRGLIQITGRFNYADCSKGLGVDFISNPELLETPRYAALSAGWFWNKHGLNKYADTGDFRGLTLRINGGLHGLADREFLYNRAKEILHVS